METIDNLKESFAGESQANQKYRAFAKQASKEGFTNVAKLFTAAAEAERIHAEGHLNAMEGIKTTAENLQAAIDGETYEYTTMYPPMLEQAEKENHKAKRMFGLALKAEEVHAKLYKKALEAVAEGKDLPSGKVYLCPICGDIEIGEVPEKCPVCGAAKAVFIGIEL